MYLYFRRFPRDPNTLKLLVLIFWVLQNFFFFVCAKAAYSELIRAMKDTGIFYTTTWELHYLGVHWMLTTTLTQMYFASRLGAYGQDPCVTFLLVVLISITLAFGIYTNKIESHQNSSAGWPQTVWNSLIAVTDTFMASYLAYLMRKKHGFGSTNSMMKLITLYGVTTGAASSVIAVFFLISGILKLTAVNISLGMVC
ncbi:hypothetical protein DL93DRAFT_492072 [Clavulina sp. PMI_390]|nr:hypothetical protein DL93DRAFT_492072 [Clavulina sp. PMI_390]